MAGDARVRDGATAATSSLPLAKKQQTSKPTTPNNNNYNQDDCDDEPSETVINHCLLINDKYFEASRILYYDPDFLDPNTGKIVGNLKIDETSFDIKKNIHNFTLKSKGKEGCRPRIYPDPSMVADLNPVVIDDTTAGEVLRIKFNEQLENCVFFASKDSKCPMLREVYNIYNENRKRIMEIVEIIQNKFAWTADTLGGGTYIPCGIAMRGGTKDSKPNLPFLMKSGKYAIIMELADIYAKILGKQAQVLRKYCPRDYEENKKIYKEGDKYQCNYPTSGSQQGNSGDNDDMYWRLHQVAIRIMGGINENSNEERDDQRIAWHVDDNDIQTKQPLTFIPLGGDDGKGGYVRDSDLIVFEHSKGGKCYRLKTCIADTIVFVFMNSGTQLHGSSKEFIIENGMNRNLSVRLIPYGRRNVQGFVQRKMDNSINGEVFLDVKLENHAPLNRNKVNVGDRVMMYYGKRKQKYLATIELHDGSKVFRFDDGRLAFCRNSAIYSAECYEHIPSECTHCNPR